MAHAPRLLFIYGSERATGTDSTAPGRRCTSLARLDAFHLTISRPASTSGGADFDSRLAAGSIARNEPVSRGDWSLIDIATARDCGSGRRLELGFVRSISRCRSTPRRHQTPRPRQCGRKSAQAQPDGATTEAIGFGWVRSSDGASPRFNRKPLWRNNLRLTNVPGLLGSFDVFSLLRA